MKSTYTRPCLVAGCFNDMSNHQGLLYAERLGNCIHCKFIFIFFILLFLESSFCLHTVK